MTPAATVKAHIRATHRAARAVRPEDERKASGENLARHGTDWAGSIARPGRTSFAAYLGVDAEPPTAALLGALHANGYTVLLPVCDTGRRLLWVRWTPNSVFARSRFASVMEPQGTRLDVLNPASSDADVPELGGIFLPATAVDRSGNRIGQGGGYYDRFLAALRAKGNIPPAAAVVYDDEILPSGAIPAEPFDMAVDEALTPGGLVPLR